MSEKNKQTRLRYFNGNFVASITKPENLKEIFESGDRDALAVYAPVSLDENTAFNLFPEIASSREAILKSTRSSISVDRTSGVVRGNIEGVSNEKISKTVEYADNNGTYNTPYPERPVNFSVFKSQSLSTVQSEDYVGFGVEVSELDGSVIGVRAFADVSLLNTPDGTYTYVDSGENVGTGLEFTFEIQTMSVPMGTSRFVANIIIVNAGAGYLRDEKIIWRMPSGEYIVEESLTDGTWSIPSEELEEDYYYTFSFTQESEEEEGCFRDCALYQAVTIRKGNLFEIVTRNQRFSLAADGAYLSTDTPRMLFTADPDKSVMTAEGMEFKIDGSREVEGGEEGVVAIQYEGSATASIDDSMKNPDVRFPASLVGNIRPVDISLEKLSENLVVYLTKEIVLSETTKLNIAEPAPRL
jgi:hypothetical protein